MSLVTRSFEGFTPGTTMTAANAGANQVVPQGTGASATYSDLYPHEGTGSAKFVASGNGLNIARFNAAATSMTASYGVGVTITATPTSNARFTAVRGSGPSVNVEWQTDNSIAVFNRVFANPITVATGLQPGTRYYLTLRLTVGTTTTNGSFLARVYDRAGTVLGSATSSTFDTGTAAITAADIGFVNTNSASGSTVYIDYLQLNDGTSTEVAVPTDAPVSYSGTLALSGTGTQDRTGTPTLTGTLTSTGEGTQTRDTSLTVASILERSAEGTSTRAGSPSFAGTVLENGSVDTALDGHLSVTQTLSRTSSASLALAPSVRLTGHLSLTTEVTLTLSGYPTKRLTPRRVAITTPRSEASLFITSRTRTEVRVR